MRVEGEGRGEKCQTPVSSLPHPPPWTPSPPVSTLSRSPSRWTRTGTWNANRNTEQEYSRESFVSYTNMCSLCNTVGWRNKAVFNGRFFSFQLFLKKIYSRYKAWIVFWTAGLCVCVVQILSWYPSRIIQPGVIKPVYRWNLWGVFNIKFAVLGTCAAFSATAPLARTKKVAHVAVALM